MSRPEPSPVPAGAQVPRPAASVVLLRDAADGPEVLMLKRHGESDVHANAYVFPGGKVDAADAALAVDAHLDSPLAQLHLQLGETGVDAATAAGLHVAALRETFEESGLLLALGASPRQLAEASERLAGGVPFNAMLAALGLRLQSSALVPWSRWITPVRGPNKRFDTRFFAARAPAQGVARHDGRETTESAWLRPRRALEGYWEGRMMLAAPQILTLAHLARFASVAAALDDARLRPPSLIEPHLMREGEWEVMCYPGDAAHPIQVRAIPGPTRLTVRDRRAEPEGGFEGFFA